MTLHSVWLGFERALGRPFPKATFAWVITQTEGCRRRYGTVTVIVPTFTTLPPD